MNKEQMREEYESWLCENFDLDPSLVKAGRGIDDLGEEMYSLETTEELPNPEAGLLASLGWFAWQASREALVIELPPEKDLPDEESYGADFQEYEADEQACFAANHMRQTCLVAIEAKGIKVK